MCGKHTSFNLVSADGNTIMQLPMVWNDTHIITVGGSNAQSEFLGGERERGAFASL